MAKAVKTKPKKSVETLIHDESKRKNIPTAEYQSVLQKEQESPKTARYQRNPDLDPQLVWRGKDQQDWSDLVVHAPPLYIQEKVHPKVLIDDLLRTAREAEHEAGHITPDLFADFNGIPKGVDKTEFYQHDQNWSNRMILGDSLQVMASLAEREGLRGKVQCIYFDPPYGIKFNSNFQWSTTSRTVTDGKVDHITREPEQVKAFRDTWRDGIHSYLTYIRDRLTTARDLLNESGSMFVQIGDENVHLIRALMDETFGSINFVSQINFKSMGALGQSDIPNVFDYIIWYAKKKESLKFRPIYRTQSFEQDNEYRFVGDPREPKGYRLLSSSHENISDRLNDIFRRSILVSSGFTPSCTYDYEFEGNVYEPFGRKSWRTTKEGMDRLAKANRLLVLSRNLYFRRFARDSKLIQIDNTWADAPAASERIFVVQTAPKFVERAMLMTTDPGDLVLDPTCGSGTTAYVAEQWGRRWITIDTSRVALALARARIMGARFPYYLLADSRDGQTKEAELTARAVSEIASRNNIRLGFVYERSQKVMLSHIANNTEIDVIWEKFESDLTHLRNQLNQMLGNKWLDWEVPREADKKWPDTAKKLHEQWLQTRIARQNEIDTSIATKAEFEYLYDKPYEDRKKVRVAGPFTVESLSPHRVLGVDENEELIDPSVAEKDGEYGAKQSFPQMILEDLKSAGVQQAHKEDKITFTALTPWPGYYICAEGRYFEGETERRAGIFIGPEFGTVTRPDLVEAARECGDANFDVLIACAFNYDAHTSELTKLGRIPILKARMNADLHMSADLKNTGKGNLFVIFGEPDISLLPEKDNQLRVKVNGVDVFDPSTGEVRSDSAEGIACWFIDTDYNGESFFVRHAYFLGQNDPYSALKTTLKAEINEDAWSTLHSDTSRPFDKPKSGRIAVKIINHLGDEVMKVFKV
jgi:adenine-specific DNA-methyltransferase